MSAITSLGRSLTVGVDKSSGVDNA